MTTPFRSLLVASAAFAMTGTALAQPAASPTAPACCPQAVQPTTLNLSADANVMVAPDIATVSAGVVTSGKTAKEALALNAQRMNAVFTAIRAAGIATRDYQTARIAVSPQYVYETGRKPRITGYQASNTLTIKIRQLESTGDVLDALVQQGANDINGPTFSLENPDEALDRARTDAMAKAMKRAELYARAAGMKIKRIASINENASWNPPSPRVYAMAAKADMESAPTPVAAGELTLSATVSLVIELEK